VISDDSMTLALAVLLCTVTASILCSSIIWYLWTWSRRRKDERW
jgi:hypothetical protein